MTPERAKAYAMNVLAGRMYTAKEMRDKLMRKSVAPSVISEIIGELTAGEFINDQLYAENYIIDSANLKGKGLYRIRQELRLKGIPADVIEYAVNQAAVSIDSKESLKAVIRQRLGSTKFHTYKDLEKFKAKLAYRGYLLSEIRDCLDEMGIKVEKEENFNEY